MKYFVISDIHGHASEMKRALKEKGFDINNPDHTLVVLGDIFDRFNEAREVYKFIKKVPQNRRILVRGNHEDLYLDLLKKNYPQTHDFANKTVETFCQIAGEDISLSDELRRGTYYIDDEDLAATWITIRNKVAKSSITKFLKSKEWKDYYELDNYIFVHAFIPLRLDWRFAIPQLWKEARWQCPWQKYLQGFFDVEIKEDKTLVCGHWHTSDFFAHLSHDLNYRDRHDIFYGTNIIAIDGGCWFDIDNNYTLTHTQNVLVIEQ